MQRIFLFILISGFFSVHAESSCSRIVPLSPSLTEVVYALGLGEKVVGVVRYAEFPEEAKAKPKVGGLLDPNFEALVRIKPDIVLLLNEHMDKISYFKELDLETLRLDHRSVRGILDSIKQIGDRCGKTSEAQMLVATLEQRIERVRARVKGVKTVTVMVAVSVAGTEDVLKGIYLSGKDGYYSELLEILGARNVYQGSTTGLSLVSGEGILSLNPEVIMVVSPVALNQYRRDQIVSAWDIFKDVRAVKERRVYVLENDYAVVPGPRFVELLEDMERFLHLGTGAR